MRSPEYGKRAQMFLGGVQFAAVAVDTETGIIRVERMVAVHDCGRPINLLGLESQVNGGVLQGISYALYEDRRLDRNTGIMVNPNLEEYKIIGVERYTADRGAFHRGLLGTQFHRRRGHRRAGEDSNGCRSCQCRIQRNRRTHV